MVAGCSCWGPLNREGQCGAGRRPVAMAREVTATPEAGTPPAKTRPHLRSRSSPAVAALRPAPPYKSCAQLSVEATCKAPPSGTRSGGTRGCGANSRANCPALWLSLGDRSTVSIVGPCSRYRGFGTQPTTTMCLRDIVDFSGHRLLSHLQLEHNFVSSRHHYRPPFRMSQAHIGHVIIFNL